MAGEASFNEDKKDGEEPKTPKELIKDFCSYTTTHGVGRLAEARTLFSRSIWTVFILGAFGMFIFQTIGLFTLYLRRPVSTVVKVKHKSVCIKLCKVSHNFSNFYYCFSKLANTSSAEFKKTLHGAYNSYQAFMHFVIVLY